MHSRYPTLVQLLGGYFHQDWTLDAPTTDDMLAMIVRHEPADRLRAALRELNTLLASGLCEPQLSDVVLYEIGCYVAPESEGLDMSVWLRRLRDVFDRAVRQDVR